MAERRQCNTELRIASYHLDMVNLYGYAQNAEAGA
jgi:hypothetical protein